MQVSVHREVFNFSWRVAKSFFDFDSATVKRKKKRKNEGKKHCGQGQRENIYLTFRRAPSLEREIDDCLHQVRRISHAVDIAVDV